MRPPALAVIGNLIWSRNGRVWAVWRVAESPYVWLADRRKHAVHSRVRAVLSALPAESMILSVAGLIDAGEVADKMMVDVDLAACPGWADAVDATLDRLEATDLFRRRHYLCVQLPDRGNRGRWAGWWRSASGPVAAGFGVGVAPIPVADVHAALGQADELLAQLGTLRLEPVRAGEIQWLYARAARRGLVGEPPLAGWPDPRVRTLPRGGRAAVVSPSLMGLLDARFKEGGDRDEPERPWHRRYLRVETAAGLSYQAFAVVADAPQQFGFPGGLSEWLMVADQMPFPVDWACRIQAVPNHTANRAVTRHQRELAGQGREYDAEPAGAPPSLYSAMDALDHERALLAANPTDPELRVAMIYSVWAEGLAELEQRVGALQNIYRAAEYHLPCPTGGQLALFEAMLPGSSTPRVCADYRQFMLPGDLAAGMPFAGVELGDGQGMLLGDCRDAGCARPVLVDPAAGPRNDRDGGVAAFGVLGSGKSYLAKRLATAVLLRGGKLVTIDRTRAGEYVRFAEAMAGVGVRTQVLTVGEPGGLLVDPLAVFTGDAAHEAAAGYLSLVCGLDPTSDQYATLDRAVRNTVAAEGHLSDVTGELERLAEEATKYRHGADLAPRLETIAANRFGAAAFGSGESVDLSADCIVFHAPHLSLPAREVLLAEHLARKISPEQLCSIGLLYLVAAVARHVAYTDRDRFAALVLDEAWALTSTPPGEALLSDVLRDGRKHNAAGWIFSQHPNDLPGALGDMVSTRLLFGLAGDAARAGLRWLGVDDSQANVDLLEHWAARRDPDAGTSTGEPECLLRDASGRVGRVAVAAAETEWLRAGFESNPTRVAARVTRPSLEAPAQPELVKAELV